MKKTITLLFAIVCVSAMGCSKEEKTPMYNENLVGKKFRMESHVGVTQVYQVLEFKSENKVELGYRTSADSPVTPEYTVILDWRKTGSTGTGIIVEYRSFMDEENDTEEVKGIITDGILSFPTSSGLGVYTEYN